MFLKFFTSYLNLVVRKNDHLTLHLTVRICFPLIEDVAYFVVLWKWRNFLFQWYLLHKIPWRVKLSFSRSIQSKVYLTDLVKHCLTLVRREILASNIDEAIFFLSKYCFCFSKSPEITMNWEFQFTWRKNIAGKMSFYPNIALCFYRKIARLTRVQVGRIYATVSAVLLQN